MSCEIKDLEGLTLIGAGGFSHIYTLKNGKVLKAIVSKNVCDDAFLEMSKQEKVYQGWERLKRIPLNDPIINNAKKLIKISKPLAGCGQPLIVDNKKFSCYFLMEKLSGIPLSMLSQLNSNIVNDLNKDFKPKDLMLQVSLNSQLPERIYGINYSKKLVGYNNPPRGYFINDNSNTLERLGFSKKELKEIIGFIYGYMFYGAKIIPVDVEFALGYYNRKYVLNVLDFGMTVDIEDPNNNVPLPRTYGFLNKLDDIEQLEKLTIEDISIDLYCDLEEDSDCRRGWDTAKILFK